MAYDNPRKFIQRAIKRPGALTRRAKAAGMSVAAYARSAMRKGSKASGLAKQQARFYAQVLRPASKKR